MGAAGDFNVGYKTGFASGASDPARESCFVPHLKILYPTFPNVGYSKQISVGAY